MLSYDDFITQFRLLFQHAQFANFFRIHNFGTYLRTQKPPKNLQIIFSTDQYQEVSIGINHNKWTDVQFD